MSLNLVRQAMISIEDRCMVIKNLPLSYCYVLGSPNRSASNLMDTEISRELQHNIAVMLDIVSHNVSMLTDEQAYVYERIIMAVSTGQSGIFFWMPQSELAKHFSYRSCFPKYEQTMTLQYQLLHLEL